MLLTKLYLIEGNDAWCYGIYRTYVICTPSERNLVYEVGSEIRVHNSLKGKLRNWVKEGIQNAIAGHIPIS